MQVLQMDESQQERFMGLRKQHLNKLRSIYQERQDLNMQVSYISRTPCCCLLLTRLMRTS